MYSIYSDSYLIYDSGIQDHVAMDPKLTLKANEAGQLTFTLPSTNPSISHITRLKSRIKVYRDSTLIFLGRIIEDSVSLDSKHVYVAEGTLAYLLDSVIRPFTAEEVTPAELFAQFLTAHNSQVNVSQQFIQGSCTVTSADTISMTTEDYISTWTAIKTYLVDAYGGYLVITFDSSENPVLSYLADVTDTATQHIEFCENLRSLVVSRNADETYTACIPLGAKQNEIDENSSSEERLTIADANDGLDYLIDSTTAAEYGIIYAPVSITTFPEEKNATYLKQKGLTWLANSGVKLKRSITLTAVDLHNLDKNVEAFSFLDKVVVSCIDISGICSSDMNANGLKGKCKKIAKNELKAGDFVFKVNSEGRATHVGYVVDDVPNVIEARGRDYGVVKGKLDSRWNAFGRPPFWNEGYVFTRALKYGRRGEDVCELKKLLQSNGYGLNLHTTNKNYLSSTRSVVKAYQKANGLTVDGKAGKDTITKLGGTYNA